MLPLGRPRPLGIDVRPRAASAKFQSVIKRKGWFVYQEIVSKSKRKSARTKSIAVLKLHNTVPEQQFTLDLILKRRKHHRIFLCVTQLFTTSICPKRKLQNN